MATRIPTPETIRTDFFTERLRAAGHDGVTVTGFRAEPIGTGQIGHCLRYTLDVTGGDGSAPTRLVGKFPALDAKSRMSGVLLTNYLREVSFYRDLQARVTIRTPRCYYADIEGRGPAFALLLEDLAPARQGDQLTGCTPEVADAAVQQLVGLHAPSFCDASLLGVDWLDAGSSSLQQLGRALYRYNVRGVLKRYGDELTADEADIIALAGESTRHPFERPESAFSLVHYDYRLDNLLLDERTSPPGVAVVDWQSVVLGNPLGDVAYFLGAGLAPEVRRRVEHDIVRRYHDSLCAAGVAGYDWDACWEDYRRGTFTGLVVTVIASMMVQQTERGDRMFATMAQRHARHVLDLGGAELLTIPGSKHPRRPHAAVPSGQAERAESRRTLAGPSPLRFPELGLYGLAGHAEDPSRLVDEAREAEALGLGSIWISERFDVKDAGVCVGAACAATQHIYVGTAATNIDTRHPLVTATMAATAAKLSHERFALGLARGVAVRSRMMGLADVSNAELGRFVSTMRKLWRGERVLALKSAYGVSPYLHMGSWLDVDIPCLFVGFGLEAVERAARVFDGIILHTFLSDDALRREVEAARRGAKAAGRDPSAVKVWSVLATVHEPTEEDRLRRIVARMATYLQAPRYGELLVAVNGWDPERLRRFRRSRPVLRMTSAIDATATLEQLREIEREIPEHWFPAAVGDAATCAARIKDQFTAGADGVILHASTPAQLPEVLEAYARVRDAKRFSGASACPA
ncbi:MAG: TIGR03857 family LLM class F420-dependent oxidoreductase [Polyangiales bacterium]